MTRASLRAAKPLGKPDPLKTTEDEELLKSMMLLINTKAAVRLIVAEPATFLVVGCRSVHLHAGCDAIPDGSAQELRFPKRGAMLERIF